MPTTHRKGAIFASFAANIAIAIAKLVAFFITGATSLLAESVHSLVDSGNQILLLIGGYQARQKPNRIHPFGYGRVHFLYALIVAIILFSLGGLFAIYQGIGKIQHPHPIESPAIAYTVLVLSMLFEGFALKTVLTEAKSLKPPQQNWWQFLRRTKSVNYVVLTVEDTAALIGLTMAFVGISIALATNNPIWDGVSTLAIGGLLILTAIFLFTEVKSLLIGESAESVIETKIRQIILSLDDIDQILDLKTLYVGPMDLFVAVRVVVDAKDDSQRVSAAINQIKAQLQQEFPIIHLIYVEPTIPLAPSGASNE